MNEAVRNAAERLSAPFKHTYQVMQEAFQHMEDIPTSVISLWGVLGAAAAAGAGYLVGDNVASGEIVSVTNAAELGTGAASALYARAMVRELIRRRGVKDMEGLSGGDIDDGLKKLQNFANGEEPA